MKVLIVLAAVAACAYSNTAATRSYREPEEIAVLEEVEVDDFGSDETTSEDESTQQDLSDSELEPEETELPDLPGLSLQTEVSDEEEDGETELSVETEVIIDGSESVPRQDGDDVDTTVGADGDVDAGLPIFPVFIKATAYSDREMIKKDLSNLMDAFQSEKTAFDNMFDKTSEMKMANKTACLTDAINQILSVSVDATELAKINSNLTTIHTQLGNGVDDATMQLYKQQILTGNNTFVTQILNEAQIVANNLEVAIDTMVIDQNC